MRELLLNKTSSPAEIPENILRQNEFVKTLLHSPASRISIELCPNSDFNKEILPTLAQEFVSVTWLGTTYLKLPAHEIPAIILARKLCEKGYSVLLHLAGRNLSKQRMLQILNELKDGGIKNILALQGDWSHVLEKDDTKCDFPYASNLVSFIRDNFGEQFCVGVAGYPDSHPRSPDQFSDIKFLQEKVSSGADFIITQAAFEYEVLEKFVKICREHNISVPILPGIFIIKSYKSLINMAKWCEFQVPKNILDFVEENKDNEVIKNYGINLAADLIKKILANKELFGGVHLFSMNDLNLVADVISKTKELSE